MQNMDTIPGTRTADEDRSPAIAGRPPLFSQEDLDQAFDEAARSGLYSSDELADLRRMRIRPSTHPMRSSDQLVKKRPPWLAFIFRLFS
jgi:hypothetical protein